MRRVIWNIPFTSKNVTIANDQVGVQIQSTPFYKLIIRALSPYLRYRGFLRFSVFYLISVRTRVGRLQVGTIVHSLTLGGKSGPGLPDSGLAGLNQVREEFDNKICKFG